MNTSIEEVVRQLERKGRLAGIFDFQNQCRRQYFYKFFGLSTLDTLIALSEEQVLSYAPFNQETKWWIRTLTVCLEHIVSGTELPGSTAQHIKVLMEDLRNILKSSTVACGGRANDEGAPVALGTAEGYKYHWYCGRDLGRDAIPGSDGRCGPLDGPQCQSCKKFQNGGAPVPPRAESAEILRLRLALETKEKELTHTRNRVGDVLVQNQEVRDEFSRREDRYVTRIRDLEEELNKVRECDMLEMLSDLSQRRVEGHSLTYVGQAAHHAGALAARLAEKAAAMRAAQDRRAAHEATMAAKRTAAEVDPPNEYLCGIQIDLMRDPVILASGQTFERKAIATWLETHETCPLTGEVLAHKHLTPNVSLRKLIDGYVNDQVVPEERAAKRPRLAYIGWV